MSRSLIVLFRRDPSRDRISDRIFFEGYRMYWPNGQCVTVGLDAFCKHGVRLFGLGNQLAGRTERMIELICMPVTDRGVRMSRYPGLRVRRFLLHRHGPTGRIHFLDGTPTEIVFEEGRDETRVLDWIGMTYLRDGQQQWFDVTARPADAVGPLIADAGSPGRIPCEQHG